MKSEHIIRITDKQSTEDGSDSVEVTVHGTFCGTPEDYTLEFDEMFGEGMQSHTVLCVKNKKSASIVRTGEINTEITVEAGKRHNCHYSTPYGELMVGIFSNHVKSSVTNDGGVLEMHYTVDFNGMLTAKKEMTVEVM